MLLDTHVLLWLLEDSPRLGPRARAAITAAPAPRFSAASTWEIALNQSRGRITVPRDIDEHLRASGLTELPVLSRHTRAVLDHPALHRHDPFDQLLVAQAVTERITFVTADRHLLASGLPFVSDART